MIRRNWVTKYDSSDETIKFFEVKFGFWFLNFMIRILPLLSSLSIWVFKMASLSIWVFKMVEVYMTIKYLKY